MNMNNYLTIQSSLNPLSAISSDTNLSGTARSEASPAGRMNPAPDSATEADKTTERNNNLDPRRSTGALPSQEENDTLEDDFAPYQERQDDTHIDNTSTHTPIGQKRTRANMNIFTFNMNGGGTQAMDEKWNHINQIVRENRMAIGAIQETHLSPEQQEELQTRFPRLRLFNSQEAGVTNSKGVVICLNKSLTRAEEASEIELIPGRALIVSIPWKQFNNRINILGIYGPNKPEEQIAFWEDLSENLDKLDARYKPDIMLGDFNLVENEIDRLSAPDVITKPENRVAVEALQSVREKLDLVDKWRSDNPTTREFSYKQAKTEKPSHSRIDRIYISHELSNTAYNWKSEHCGIPSDHKLVSVRLEIPNMPYIGPGRWQLPLFLLENEEMMNETITLGQKALQNIKTHKQTVQSQTPFFAQKTHQELKDALINRAQQIARKLVPKVRKQILEERKKIKALLNPTEYNAENDETKFQKIAEAEERIKSLQKKIHTETRENINARHNIEAETISKTWIMSSKEKKPRDTILRLRIPNSNPAQYTTKSQEMADTTADYHRDIQNADITHVDADDVTRDQMIDNSLNILKTSLSNEDKSKMSFTITQEEIRGAIKNLPNGKSPGLDGIPTELYAKLNEIYENRTNDKDNTENEDTHHEYPNVPEDGFNVVKYLHYIFEEVQLEGTYEGSKFSEGWLCPIHKKNDIAEISNYRPITVLNTDYKIMTKALTTRLSQVTGSIIHPDQAGFMKGRRIEDHTDLVHTLLHLCEIREENGAIFCLDQEKAYDKIRHDFLWKSLKRFGFPDTFINTVKNLYNHATTTVIINGVLSKSFQVTRGVRQGDPLSCLLFNIAIESLAETLRDSPLKGIRVGDNERIIASLFADDTTVYLSEDDEAALLFNLLHNWCRSSGAKFNVTKTEIIPIGTSKYRENLRNTRKMKGTNTSSIGAEIRIASDNTPVRVLGTWVGYDIDTDAIWNKNIDEINTILNRWERSHPTQEGRRLLVNMYVAGKTQYLTRELYVGKWHEPHAPPIRASVLQKDHLSGGRKVLNIKARNEAIDLMRMKTYLKPTQERPTWTKIVDEIISESVPKSSKFKDKLARYNYLLQTWSPAKREGARMPESILRMIKTAQKYNLQFDPRLLSNEAKLDLPIWYHLGRDSMVRVPTEGRTATECLRKKHHITTVRDMLQLAETTHTENHIENDECECDTCLETENEFDCKTPHTCVKLARRWIDSLLPKWNPRFPNLPSEEEPLVQTLTGDETWVIHPTTGRRKIYPPTVFNQDLMTRTIPEGFRLFAQTTPDEHTPNALAETQATQPQATTNDGDDHEQNTLGQISEQVELYEKTATRRHTPDRASIPASRTWNADKNEHSTPVITTTSRLQLDARTINSGQVDAIVKCTVFFGDEDQRNKTIIIRGPYAHQSLGEAIAINAVVRDTPDQHIIVETKKNSIAEKLNQTYRKKEKQNFAKTSHKGVWQMVLSTLRKHRGLVTFVQGPCTKARDMHATEQPNTEDINIGDMMMYPKKANDIFIEDGLHLVEATQALLYQNILLFNEEKARMSEQNTRPKKKRKPNKQNTNTDTQRDVPQESPPETEINRHARKERQAPKAADIDEYGNSIRNNTQNRLNMAREACQFEKGKRPTDRELWKSLKNKNISRKIKAFMWSLMHKGQRTGDFWENKPGFTDRIKCPNCEEIENMEHILFKCKASGQKHIWNLTKDLFELKGIEWSTPTIGSILSAGVTTTGTKLSPEKKGRDRLRTIILTESRHLIWKLRCEWRIQRKDDPSKKHSKKETINRWVAAINIRLKLDCLYTNKKLYKNKAIGVNLVLETWKGTLQNEHQLPKEWTGREVLVGIRATSSEPHTEVRNRISSQAPDPPWAIPKSYIQGGKGPPLPPLTSQYTRR
ncbi:hypothetical protein CVT24_009763 [Panaeolus cyanescens]|uniref:Reverse transcriptase domain-containing protein n=1 Tax=Panaeolus cyanescens TaxID=181874 RepID=A0A409WEW6_9AGAR|nr:hypothetical protein CVT24_009763 [Panaeolus cyanescens]